MLLCSCCLIYKGKPESELKVEIIDQPSITIIHYNVERDQLNGVFIFVSFCFALQVGRLPMPILSV